MSQKQALQNAHSTKFLNYGHLGRTTYDQEEKTWKTLRSIESHSTLAAAGRRFGDESHTAFPLRHLSSKVVYEGFAASQCQNGSQNYGRNCDDTAQSGSGPNGTSIPAAQAADTFECENQDFGGSLLDSADADFEPRSEPLAFGGAFLTASEGIRSDHVYIPIAASVSGITGRSLRLALIRDDILGNGEDDTEESPIHLPSISKDDQAYWTNNGGPIQQICFASTSGYASTWMAVRLLCSTTICHPLIHEGLMPPRRETYSAPSGALYRSRLDANPVITIPMSRTGGHPHADITFHPRDYSRIAVIDEHGNWSVWSLEEERQESSYPRFHASLFGCGKIWTWDFEKRWRGSPPYHDRWHRIFWCATTENQSEGFFVCNRRTAAVYANSGDLLALLDLRLGHARENQWILDVKPITSIPGHYLVLTTSYLFWMSLGDRQSDKLGNTQNATHILLAWQHFRDGGDRTLHLVSLETGSTTVVLIASFLVDIASVFRIGRLDGHEYFPVSQADPLHILLPKAPDRVLSRHRPRSLLFRAIECRYDGQVDRASSQNLFKLYSLYPDFSIVEHIYRSTETGFKPTAEWATSCILSLPSQELLSRLAGKYPRRRDLEDFIVPDDWVERDEDPAGSRRRGRYEYPKKTLTTQTKRYRDWQDIYAHLIDESKNSTRDSRTQVDALLKQFQDHLNESTLPGVHLLSEILSSRLHITDIDYDSEYLESLISTFNSHQHVARKLVRHPIFLYQSRAPPGLTSIYDTIVSNHLTPLSHDAPDRVRVNKERLARKVAADIFLASTALCPILPSSTEASIRDLVPRLPSSQPTNPYPSPAETISQPSSSASNTLAMSTAEEDPIITRLRTYARISPPTSTLPIGAISTNRTLSSILRHLPTSPVTNPTSYSWRATERLLAAEHENETLLAADPQARRKAEKAKLAQERREEARRRRFAEEAVRSQRVMPIVMSSQVGSVGGAREVQSSQVQARDDYGPAGSSQGQRQEPPMTQPEMGLFGARPNIATAGFGSMKVTKGKKRAAGF